MQRTQYEDPPQAFVDTTWTAQEDTAPIVPVRRNNNFVPAPRVTQATAVQPLETFNVPTPSTSVTELRTTYEDRSKGFLWAIAPVAIVTGVLSCVAGVALFRVPLLSWSLLQTFLAVFCATWVVGYVSHLVMSPDGALFANTWQLWRTVGREQQFRHDRYWQEYTDSRRDAGLDVRPASRRRR